MASTTLLEPPVVSNRPAAEETLYEIINGQRVELPPMGAYASLIASWLHINMGSFVEAGRLGILAIETLFILDAKRNLRRRPDIAFVSTERWPPERPIPEQGDWEVIPDLAVEVSSPNDLLKDVLAKIEEYFAFGVRQVWLVVPTRQCVLVFDTAKEARILTAADELDGGILLPGFRLPLVSLFQHQAQTDTPASA
jgi:Uma2 family endonuclease